ncbi:MAG: FAD binding domain-containing protein [Anaerolineae bacterium]|nr:FAD binding domain-containing protein [Anaerolineae bacterium]
MLRNVQRVFHPTTIEEAVTMAQTNPHACYLGGGAWVVAQGEPQLEAVVDLQGLGLGKIESDIEGVQIGALVTLQQLIDAGLGSNPVASNPVSGALVGDLLATTAAYTQSRTLREQGTVGGTLIVAGPADPLTTALLVLDADVRYADPVVHTAPFTSFVAYRDRLIRTRVLLTGLLVKRPPTRSAAAFEVVGRSPKDKPIVCVAAYVAVDEGLPVEVRIAVGGADAHPMRLLKTEHLLKGQLLTASRIESALAPVLMELHPVADFLATAEYRLEMTQVLTRRAVLSAWERARRA